MNHTAAALLASLAMLSIVPAQAQSAPPATSRRNVAIVLYDGMELLDFAGPGEVFQAAGKAFNVYTVAATSEPIVSQSFVKIVPEYTIETSPKPDILVIPGGNAANVARLAPLVEWVIRSAQASEVTLSVCTGAFVLAKAGLLDGLHATTWHGAIGRLRDAAPKATIHENVRFVDNGRYVTTAGVSAGIDGALHVVSRLLGEEQARSTARYMEYDKWDPKAGMVADANLRDRLVGEDQGRRDKERREAALPVATAGLSSVGIVVSDDGFAPSVIELRAGVTTRLVFDRQTRSSCFEQVAIPELGVAPVATPYGVKTSIEVTPREEGRFRFACGMDMFRGTLLVQR